MADDKVTAYLAEAEARNEQSLGPSVTALPVSVAAVRVLMESAADIPRLIAAVRAGLDLHKPFGIYDECDHDHSDKDVAEGVAVDAGFYFACNDALQYRICTGCCTSGGDRPEQTEECVTHHDHGPGKPWCRTYQAMAAELLEEVPADEH